MRLEKPCHTGNRTSLTNRRMVRKMWVLWNGPIPPGKWVLHHCDNPPCDEITHLYLGTPKQNTADMDRRNRRNSNRGKAVNVGMDNPRAKLTEADVRDIREMAKTFSVGSIASIYEIHRSTISRIISHQLWRIVK